jgi:hypothetical protein
MNNPIMPTTGAGGPSSYEAQKHAARQIKKAQAGVIEARPGIIETTNIDPLNEHSNDGVFLFPALV